MAKALARVYKLSCELIGHNDEVRNLAVFKDGSIVSTSKDKTARLWRTSGGNYAKSIIMMGHNDFVSSVCVIEPNSKNPKGFILTGSNDKNICIYYPGEEQPIHIIKAHENAVCSLRASVFETESFLSCSSDHTGKLWNLYDLEHPRAIFSGHSLTTVVWCIVDLYNGSAVTGGSDKVVIVYSRNGKVLHKLYGHTDCIRDIAVINDNEFLTCGNDAVTKHWNGVTGICLGTYHGHSSHIYSISAIFGGSLAASCGEDKTVKVWRNGQVDQTIAVPAETVWSVRILPNEDLVCGSSDGVVRIFTFDDKRFINQKAMQKFEEAVLNNIKHNAKLNKLNDLDITDTPRSSELNQPGEKDGDTIIVKDGSEVKAYRWSEQEFQWKLIGDIVESKTENLEKQMFNGIEYDYVFSVDIKKGAPLLKLPYNKDQDPYVAAMQFIENNDLDPNYIDKVANFIVTNLQIRPILNAEAQYQSHFTGGSRYVSNTLADNIFQPSSSSEISFNSLVSHSYIPQTQYLKLEQGNISMIYEKLKEFNTKNENKNLSVTDDTLKSLKKLVTDENSVTIEDVDNLKSLLNWPDETVFPVLDIIRLGVLHENVNRLFVTNGILENVKRHIKNDSLISNQMLTFRVLANLFSHKAGEQLCLQYKNDLLTAISDLSIIENKNNQVAISTFILNLVVAFNKENDIFGKTQILNVIFKLLEKLKETEAVFRILVGLGSLIMEASNIDERERFINSVKQSRPVLKALRILLDNVETSNVPNKLLSVTRQILEMIKR